MPFSTSLLSGNMRGIGYMMMAMLAGVITSMVVKHLSPLATILVMLSVRFVFSMPWLSLAAWVARRQAMARINRWDRLIMRIVVGHIGIIFWFLSIRYSSLGQATALFQSSAIFVTILAPLILKETVGIYRGSAVFVGLFGIYLITDPLAGGMNIGSAYGVGSALAGAVLVVVLRLLGRTEEPVSVAFWHNLVGAVVYPAITIALLQEADILTDITVGYFPMLVLLGIAATFVQIGFTAAYRYGEAAVLVPIRYLSVPIASFIGWYVWQEALSVSEICGMAIVVLSCLFISGREYILNRRAAAS